MVVPHVAAVAGVAAVIGRIRRAATGVEHNEVGDSCRGGRGGREPEAHRAAGSDNSIPEGRGDRKRRALLLLDHAIPERGDLALVVKLHPPALHGHRRGVGEHHVAIEAAPPLIADLKARHEPRHHGTALEHLVSRLRRLAAAASACQAPAVLARTNRWMSGQRHEPIKKRAGTHSNLFPRCFPDDHSMRAADSGTNPSTAAISHQGSRRIPAGNCPAPSV